MTNKIHKYTVNVTWVGNNGTGTSSYESYSRSHVIQAEGKQRIEGSSDPSFRGDPACWNPEELLLASLAACHKLWYLNLCAKAGLVVVSYVDNAEGTMTELSGGGGQFTAAILRPTVVLAYGADVERARHLHEVASKKCFIARSVNFPVAHFPEIIVKNEP